MVPIIIIDLHAYVWIVNYTEIFKIIVIDIHRYSTIQPTKNSLQGFEIGALPMCAATLTVEPSDLLLYFMRTHQFVLVLKGEQ